MGSHPLDQIPIWALYVLTALAMLTTMEVGYRLSRAVRKKAKNKTDVGLGGMVGACLALLAFLLAFVVGFGASIDAKRRQIVVAEANAIGTAYLRAGILDEARRDETRKLLREYTDLRLVTDDFSRLPDVVDRSEQIHNELWAGAEKLAAESPTPTVSLYLTSLNDVIDRHTERIAAGVDNRVPPSVLLGLYVVALFSTFLVGVRSGDGDARNYMAHVVLVLILSVVFVLIVDLDRAHEGLLVVPQHALEDLQRQMASPL